jgi:PAS domain S-box-containing protein
MRFGEIKKLVESTSDAAFAVDGLGQIVAWNRAAESLFGMTAQQAIGQACGQIVQGMDECGAVCSENCSVQQAARKHHPIGNFDLQVQTKQGRQWCNISVLTADEVDPTLPYTIHIIRPVDVSKRLELLVRDFIVTETGLPAEQATKLASSKRTPTRETDLTKREVEILGLLAKGATTASIADQLGVSRTTINNHIQHILRKLNAHSRLEAIRRAEHAGLI